MARPGSLRRWGSLAVVLALLAAMAIHVWARREELASVQRLTVGVLALAGLLQFGAQLFLNASMLLPLRVTVKGLGFWELYAVRTGGGVVGGLVPVAGSVAVRLAYLRRLGISYGDFAWATLLSNILGLAAAGVVTVIAIVLFWLLAGPPPPAVLPVAAVVITCCVGALATFEYIPRLSRYRLLRRFQWLSAMPGWRENPRLTARVLGHSVGRHLLNFVTFGVVTAGLTLGSGDFIAGGLVYALTSPLRMINITPGNLGVMEWATAFAGDAVAFDLTTWLIAAGVFRVIGLAAQAMGVVVGLPWMAAMREDRRPTA